VAAWSLVLWQLGAVAAMSILFPPVMNTINTTMVWQLGAVAAWRCGSYEHPGVPPVMNTLTQQW